MQGAFSHAGQKNIFHCLDVDPCRRTPLASLQLTVAIGTVCRTLSFALCFQHLVEIVPSNIMDAALTLNGSPLPSRKKAAMAPIVFSLIRCLVQHRCLLLDNLRVPQEYLGLHRSLFLWWASLEASVHPLALLRDQSPACLHSGLALLTGFDELQVKKIAAWELALVVFAHLSAITMLSSALQSSVTTKCRGIHWGARNVNLATFINVRHCLSCVVCCCFFFDSCGGNVLVPFTEIRKKLRGSFVSKKHRAQEKKT
ncbi:unnamed protein product [Bodo saltans]|uniref:Uncharacterized protein n=1 Tax=Bodo saltans TaxID=75058 RepID=A0A0S4J5Q8_BODSA|nr:unnamed protein product [Bodo saltans]|eukprot:CUG86506.1 unnamed protein product [Bodo saltans]